MAISRSMRRSPMSGPVAVAAPFVVSATRMNPRRSRRIPQGSPLVPTVPNVLPRPGVGTRMGDPRDGGMARAGKTTLAGRIGLATLLVLAVGGIAPAQTRTALVHATVRNTTVPEPNLTLH